MPWRKTGYRSWRRRVFRPPVQAAGLEITRPYDLRHAFASLLIREGRLSLAEIAEQMGNSVATIEAVEQLTRYIERIRHDPAMAHCRGVLAAQPIKRRPARWRSPAAWSASRSTWPGCAESASRS